MLLALLQHLPMCYFKCSEEFVYYIHIYIWQCMSNTKANLLLEINLFLIYYLLVTILLQIKVYN